MREITSVLVVLFGLGFSTAFSQIITITDYNTKAPISGVYIYDVDETNSVVTDSLGKADLGIFKEYELLVFSHTAYTQVLLRKQDLYTSRYQLELHPVTLNLDEFVISANKRIQAQEEVPNRLASITAKEIRINDPQTSADMIEQSGQVFVQRSQMGGGSPVIRGFAANKVLIVVDGVRMNNAIFRGGNLQNVISIDPNMIEKSEVVFGPGSVIYGSDALGGVMDFQTIENRYSDSTVNVSGHAFARFSSANQELTPHVDFSINGKKFSSVTSITYSQYGDLKMGTNGRDEYLRERYVETRDGKDTIVNNPDPLLQTPTSFSSLSLMQKFGLKVNEKLRLNYSLIWSNTTEIPRYDRHLRQNDNGDLKYARWDYGPQKWMMNTLSLNYNNPNTVFDNLKVTLAFQDFEESRIVRDYQSPTESNRTENVEMYSANFDFDNAVTGRTTVYYGLESVYNVVNSTAYEETNEVRSPIQTRYPDGSTYWSNAAYINVKVNRNKKHTVVFGARYNQVAINAEVDSNFYLVPGGNTIEQNTGALTGSIGMAYRPNKTWQVNSNFSSGFKAPNIDDIAKFFDSEPGKVMVPNPELTSEYLYTVDGLVSKKFGKDLQYKVELSGYYSFLVDAMVRRNTQVNGQDSILYDGELMQAQTLTNTGSANLTGASLNASAKLSESWTLSTNMTYTYGRDDDGFFLPHIAPFFGNFHAIFTLKKLRLNGYINFNGQKPNRLMSPTELSKPEKYVEDENGNLYSPGWYTLNLRGSYTLNSNFLLTLGVENMTNQRYRSYSSGIVAPGLNVIASVKATF